MVYRMLNLRHLNQNLHWSLRRLELVIARCLRLLPFFPCCAALPAELAGHPALRTARSTDKWVLCAVNKVGPSVVHVLSKGLANLVDTFLP